MKSFLLLFGASVLFWSCDDDEPTFGNDGAVLESIDLRFGNHLLAEIDHGESGKMINGLSYSSERLHEVRYDGTLMPAPLRIKGTANGGFDRCYTYDQGELSRFEDGDDGNYLIVFFYLRNELYFINKTTGVATKSTLMFSPDGGFATFKDKDLVFRDYFNRFFRINNFLDSAATITEIKAGNSIKFLFDKDGTLLYKDVRSLYSYVDGSAKLLSSTVTEAWEDLNGSLSMLDVYGYYGPVTAKGATPNTYMGFKPGGFRPFMEIYSQPHLGIQTARGIDQGGYTYLVAISPRVENLGALGGVIGSSYMDVQGFGAFTIDPDQFPVYTLRTRNILTGKLLSEVQVPLDKGESVHEFHALSEKNFLIRIYAEIPNSSGAYNQRLVKFNTTTGLSDVLKSDHKIIRLNRQ